MMALRDNGPGVPLADLLHGIVEQQDVPDLRVTGICLDSRRARPGDLFCALPGTVTSGARYLAEAIRAGAAAALVDAQDFDQNTRYPIPVRAVMDLQHKTGIVAARFFPRNRSVALTISASIKPTPAKIWFKRFGECSRI